MTERAKRRLFIIDLSSPAMREVMDGLIISSITAILYGGLEYAGGTSVLSRLLGTPLETPPMLYFLGIALVLFSVRRIRDGRRERMQRIAAEQDALRLSRCDPLTQLPNRSVFEND